MDLLNGIKVLDVGTAMAGPYAATILCDLGADVIKVEKPKRGDLIRFTDSYVKGQSGYFLGINRGKRSVTVDVRTPEGQEIIRRMACEVDILVENFRPKKMGEWNLDYASLSAVNPRLIYASVSMYGDARGFEQLTGNDKVAQAVSGLLDQTGEPEGPPQRVGGPVIDAAGGFLATIGILAALHRRSITDRGEHVRVSLLEAAYSLMPVYTPSILNSDAKFRRQGNKHPLLAPYQIFRASDGEYMVIGAFHQESWRRLCRAVGREELIDDPRFADNPSRVKNRAELDPIIEEIIATRPASEWQEVFEQGDVPVSQVLSVRDSIAMFRERIPGLVVTSEHPTLGELDFLRPPIQFDGQPPVHELRASPLLGEDTDATLKQMGYDDNQIAELHEAGVI